MDYQKELENYPDADTETKAELSKLASLQKDIAIAGSAEDFIRHPFFKAFENRMNEVINDTKGAILKIEKLEELKAYQAKIQGIIELKAWLNSKVMAGRIAQEAISFYEKETADLNETIQTAVEKSQSEL